MPTYETAREILLKYDAMSAFVDVHDPTREHFNKWYGYNPKLDRVLGDVLGGWLLFSKRGQERLGTVK